MHRTDLKWYRNAGYPHAQPETSYLNPLFPFRFILHLYLRLLGLKDYFVT